MSTDLTFATGKFPKAIRFVLVNNRIPRTDHHCALCGGLIEEGYVRDSQTRLTYCDTQCFAAWAYGRPPSSKIVEGKHHEMFKSGMQSRHWSCRLSARLVQQAALLFKALPRCVRG